MKTIKDALDEVRKAGGYEAGMKLISLLPDLSPEAKAQARADYAALARDSYAAAADITAQVLRNRESEEAQQVVREVLGFLCERMQ